jgi:two-component system cell cycle sensor histidine kinase/response regulator CckA
MADSDAEQEHERESDFSHNAPTDRNSRAPSLLKAELHYGVPLFGYVLAVALVAVTGVGRLALFGYAEFLGPFLLFFPAIALASFLGGVGPGLAAIVLSAGFDFVFFPRSSLPATWIAMAVVGPLLATGCAHLRHLLDESRAAARELARFKFISDQASDAILLLEERGRISYANRAASAILGRAEQELLGAPLARFVPDSHKSALADLLRRARSGSVQPQEMTFEQRNGSQTTVELACTGVRIEGDYIVRAAARDVTERKQIDQKLREVRHFESLGVLAGGVAHEFNNLLTSIMGNASLAKETLQRDHEAVRMLEGVMSSCERSAELVRMMLATAGYRPRYNESLQLDGVLSWMLSMRSLPANIHLSTEFDAAPFGGDRRSLETLLWALISNAVESYGGEPGEVRIRVRSGVSPANSEPASFEEGDCGTGQCLGITVEDNGSGMAAEVLSRAFDPFFSTKFTGRGLGLPAVRGIVRAYSGKLRIDTAPGRGTRVEVWLPIAEDAGPQNSSH